MLRALTLATLTAMGALAATRPAEARVQITVDLASQTMQVESAEGSFAWPISSARDGFHTPRGTFGVQRMEAMHRSRKYHNSPMPHSLFFTGGYAIHGTYEIAALGQPASHGCIRLAPENAAALYEMVAAEGGRISVVGGTGATRVASRGRARDSYAAHGLTYTPDDDEDAAPALFGNAPQRDDGAQRWWNDPSGW